MMIRFILYGFFGLLLEVFWTGINSVFKGDKQLKCTTSLWMFPIYGMAVVFEPVMNLIITLPIAVRGVTYMLCIFMAEYYTGTALKRFASCPWDYTESYFNIQGVVRLDYAPLWFMVGLMYELVYRTFLFKF